MNRIYRKGLPLLILSIHVKSFLLRELKAVKALAPEHHAQVINYLNATGTEVALLINFGSPRLEYRRFTRGRDKRG